MIGFPVPVEVTRPFALVEVDLVTAEMAMALEPIENLKQGSFVHFRETSSSRQPCVGLRPRVDGA